MLLSVSDITGSTVLALIESMNTVITAKQNWWYRITECDKEIEEFLNEIEYGQ